MSVVSDALSALREALKLADDVKRTGETLKELARESRDQDRRITRLEAQWETAMQMTGRASGVGQPSAPNAPAARALKDQRGDV